MTFTINTISLCPGGGHTVVQGTVSGVSRTLTINKNDFALDPDDKDDAVIVRIRSAVKEANASTLQQIKTALEGKTFKV